MLDKHKIIRIIYELQDIDFSKKQTLTHDKANNMMRVLREIRRVAILDFCEDNLKDIKRIYDKNEIIKRLSCEDREKLGL